MLSIPEVMKALGTQRPIFHSEADFQHAFAWEIQRRLPNASIRLERPVSPKNRQLHLDVLITLETKLFAIELKYKKRDLECQVGGEQFVLRGDSAEDCGRYDFIKDIERLEQIVWSEDNATGYAILLTNDSLYWTRARDADPIDRAFRLHDGSMLNGTLSWSARAGKGTTASRERPLNLQGSYKPQWEDYSCPTTKSYGVFRFLALRVEK